MKARFAWVPLALILIALAAWQARKAEASEVINLPTPTAQQDGALVPYTLPPTQTVVIGFSANGNYVQGLSEFKYSYGGGRGGAYHIAFGCAHVTWDLSGNLISVVPFACVSLPSLEGYYRLGVIAGPNGYEADTIVVPSGISWRYQPQLVTP